MSAYTVAILGATGMVGRMFVKILEERNTPVKTLRLFASARSAGQAITFRGEPLIVEELSKAAFDGAIDAALFAVEADLSRQYAPLAAQSGCVVVDNSSAWRADLDVPLVVPEVNAVDIREHKNIIANPNCCAVPASIALAPLHRAYGVARAVISTYQSVSGSGVQGVEDLEGTMAGKPAAFYPHTIAHNLIPHIDRFHEDGYTGEERKLMFEIKKILHGQEIKITATTVRVPVFTGHSLSINISLRNPYAPGDIRDLYANAPGVVLMDDPQANKYPTPLIVAGTDQVYIGRLRRDDSADDSLNMWVCADNVRKGAATNAVQILEMVMQR